MGKLGAIRPPVRRKYYILYTNIFQTKCLYILNYRGRLTSNLGQDDHWGYLVPPLFVTNRADTELVKLYIMLIHTEEKFPFEYKLERSFRSC